MTAPAIVASTSGFDTTNVTSSTIILPSFTDGDSLYLLIASDAVSQTFSLPQDSGGSSTGFTALYSNVAIPATSATATFAVFYLTNAQHSRFSFDGSNYSMSAPVGTSERQAWWCISVSGDGGIDSQGTTSTGNSATATIPDITTLTNNCLVIGAVLTDGVSTPHGTATGYTKIGEVSGTSAASVSAFYQTAATAGTITSQNVTISTEQWAGISFAIKEVVTGRTGTASITLGTATTTAAGSVAIKGSSTTTLDQLTLSGAGNVPRTATASVTFDALTLSGAGNVPRTGSASVTFDALTLSASGTGVVNTNGTASVTLGALTGSGAGNVPIVGTANPTLGALTTSAGGVVPIVGTANPTLGALTVSASGGGARTGSGAITLDPLTVSASGTVPVVLTPPSIRAGWSKGADAGNTTSTIVTLDPSAFNDGDTVWIAIVSDAGSQVFTAPARFTALYSNVNVSGSTATLAVFYQRNISKALESFDGTNYTFAVGVATSERQSWICFATTGDGTIDVQGTTATGSSTAATIPTLTTTANADLVLGIVATDGTTTPHTSTGAYTKLDESAGVSAGSISIWYQTKSTAGAVAADTVNIVNEQWAGVSFALAPSLGGRASITLGALTTSATGTMAIHGSAAITLDPVITTSAGTVPRTGSAAITLDPVTVNSSPQRTGSAAITLGSATVAATGSGTAPRTGTAAITLGAMTTSATGSLGVDLPAPTVRAYSSGFDTGNTTATNVILPAFQNGDTLYIALVSDRVSQTFNIPAPYFAPGKPFAALHKDVAVPTTSPTATFALFYLQNAQQNDFSFDGTNYSVVVSVVIPERQSYIAIAVTGDGGADEQGINVTGSSATATIPAITTAKNNSLIVGIVATDGDSTPHTGATGYTKLTEVDGPSAGSLSLWTHVLGTAGAYSADSVSILTEQWLGVSFSIPPTLPGRASITLDPLTTSATGAIPVMGSAALALGDLTTTTSGTVPRTGSAAITLDALTINSYPPRQGSATITLGGISVASAGIVRSGRIGNAAIALGSLAVSAAGQTTVPRPTQITNVEAQSPLATIFTISVENATGVKLGGGPIVTGAKWTYKQKLSAAGEWSLEVPLAEPRLTAATLKRRVHCYVRRSGQLVWLGGGVIESRSYGLSGDNVPMMTLSGPDLLRELAGVTVGFEVNSTETDDWSIAILRKIFEAVPSWQGTVPATLPKITARFVHESVLNALVGTCEKLGAFFWMEPYVTRPRSIMVATAPVVSAIVATNMADPLLAERNPNLCLISNIERTETSWDAYNRLIVYGAGDGQARLTLAMATQWPDGSSVNFSYLFTDPYGRQHEFVLDKITNTITDVLAVAEYGTIEQAAAFKEIAPITPNDADMIAAANTLVVAAVNQLVLSSFPTESYRLSVAALRAVVHPGMQIRVIARKYRDGLPYINVDQRLIIQEVDYEIDETGEKVTGLTVATTWKPEKTGATILSEQIQKITALEAHPQMGANENTISYREDVDDDYGAAFPFWLSRGTVTVNSIILRYKLEPLRSSVKTIGGTASGSVSLPAHSHSVSVPAHQHGVDIDSDATTHGFARTMYFDPTSGKLYYDLSGGGANAFTSQAGGSATVTSGGGGNGTVSVDISNAITAVYGVFVDPNTPYTVDDLAWTANGQPVTATPVPIHGGWYEVDLTTLLVDATTLRPAAYDNTVEVTVKPINKADKRVRVTAQIELRTSVQTIVSVGDATPVTGGVRP